MSVINQMLKDLDKRNPEANSTVTQATHIVPATSPVKTVIITTVVVLVLCSISFYIWQLVNEITELKTEKQHSTVNSSGVNNTPVTHNLQDRNDIKLDNTTDNARYDMDKDNDADKTVVAPINASNTLYTQQNDTNISRIKANNDITKVTPVTKKMALIEDSEHKEQTYSHSEAHANNITHQHDHQTNTTTDKKMPTATVSNSERSNMSASDTVNQTNTKQQANKMTVSRRQLSAEELAQQKIALAEKALSANQVIKAEKLLEDVVILTPNDSQTRKKLAALWFGREAHRDATNLLSQGIVLDSQDSSLREMKARIHLQQGQLMEALNTLKPLADLKDEQYQVMLANTAQQAQQHDTAIYAYKILIELQPTVGRWQLGIAVIYDKTSQFDLAKDAYLKALKTNDLSVSSEEFIKQRIQAIGQ